MDRYVPPGRVAQQQSLHSSSLSQGILSPVEVQDQKQHTSAGDVHVLHPGDSILSPDSCTPCSEEDLSCQTGSVPEVKHTAEVPCYNEDKISPTQHTDCKDQFVHATKETPNCDKHSSPLQIKTSPEDSTADSQNVGNEQSATDSSVVYSAKTNRTENVDLAVKVKPSALATGSGENSVSSLVSKKVDSSVVDTADTDNVGHTAQMDTEHEQSDRNCDIGNTDNKMREAESVKDAKEAQSKVDHVKTLESCDQPFEQTDQVLSDSHKNFDRTGENIETVQCDDNCMEMDTSENTEDQKEQKESLDVGNSSRILSCTGNIDLCSEQTEVGIMNTEERTNSFHHIVYDNLHADDLTEKQNDVMSSQVQDRNDKEKEKKLDDEIVTQIQSDNNLECTEKCPGETETLGDAANQSVGSSVDINVQVVESVVENRKDLGVTEQKRCIQREVITLEEEEYQSVGNKDSQSITEDTTNHGSIVASDVTEDIDGESWDTMFDDDGECLDPSALEELTKTVGKVKIQKSKNINYLDYQPKDKSNFDFSQYEHVIEIYGFPAEFVTSDLIMAFKDFMSRGFDLKWVDDTHALGIFNSAIAARDALNLMHPLLKVCPLSQASKQSQQKARGCVEFLQPYKPRPETTASAARRLVAGALGIATNVSKEKREKERQQLKEAKAKKRQDRQNREEIWEYGRCAMDQET